MTECTCNCRKCRHCIHKQGEASNIKTEEVKVSLWFNQWERKSYITLYRIMLSSYNKTNEVVYNNLTDRFDQYQEEIYNELINNYSSDPADLDYTEIGSEASYRVEQDLLMKYQFHFSSLVNLYQVFEQQIRKLLYKELNHHLSGVRTKEEMPKFATKFGEIKKLLKTLNYPLGNTPSWSTIDELNKIANTYKHGDGNSATTLYRQNKDIFVNEATCFFYYDEAKTKEEEQTYINSLDPKELENYRKNEKMLLIDRELTTNMEIVLRQDKTPFEKYVNAIINFWETFPKHYETMVEVEEELAETELL
ncbi:hypothetical protein [Bacillus arachidis]|uniref:hypothetical protein n=1 Tax=Bacillus arachidis TaxID=2819290 RepID=UPI00255D10CF|nr:hypothetical protein [Bacillus arachidis]WIY58988.1 hypothetical protein QRY57_01505 [Bacillus arachidis]